MYLYKDGPVSRYNTFVASGMVREDPFQRSIINILQDMHDRLLNYDPPLITDVRDEMNSESIFGKVIKSFLTCNIEIFDENINICIVQYSYLNCLVRQLKAILLIVQKDYIYMEM